MQIKQLNKEHWNFVKAIYENGIASGNATFEIQSPGWEKWNDSHLPHSRFIAVENEKIVGWSALTSVSERCVYSGIAEVSVYVEEESRGKGIGNLLLKKLIEASEQNDIWTLQAGIFPENIASIKIHEKNGFRMIGYREKIGRINGIWRDTILFERRSKVIGI